MELSDADPITKNIKKSRQGLSLDGFLIDTNFLELYIKYTVLLLVEKAT